MSSAELEGRGDRGRQKGKKRERAGRSVRAGSDGYPLHLPLPLPLQLFMSCRQGEAYPIEIAHL